MSALRKYEVEVTFEMRRTFAIGAEDEDAAESFAVQQFRADFADAFDAAPSASDLDVYVQEVG